MITYIDLGAGVAGDMLLGALIGLGISKPQLARTLQNAIPLKRWSLQVTSVERRMWPAQAVRVKGDRPFTNTTAMHQIIRQARLPKPVIARALGVFSTLRAAEAQAHGHAHDRFDAKGLGRIDTLVDVLGTSWCFWRLGIRGVEASALNTGRLAPATSAMVKKEKIPVFTNSARHEFATPTGVAILTQIVDKYHPMPQMLLLKSGYGAGALMLKDKPNVLVIHQGNPSARRSPHL